MNVDASNISNSPKTTSVSAGQTSSPPKRSSRLSKQVQDAASVLRDPPLDVDLEKQFNAKTAGAFSSNGNNSIQTPVFIDSREVGSSRKAKNDTPPRTHSMASAQQIPEQFRLFLGMRHSETGIVDISEAFKKLRRDMGLTDDDSIDLMNDEGKRVSYKVGRTLSREESAFILTAVANVFAEAARRKEQKAALEKENQHEEHLAEDRNTDRSSQTLAEAKADANKQEELNRARQSPFANRRVVPNPYEETQANEARQTEKVRIRQLFQANRQDHIAVDNRHKEDQAKQEHVNNRSVQDGVGKRLVDNDLSARISTHESGGGKVKIIIETTVSHVGQRAINSAGGALRSSE